MYQHKVDPLGSKDRHCHGMKRHLQANEGLCGATIEPPLKPKRNSANTRGHESCPVREAAVVPVGVRQAVGVSWHASSFDAADNRRGREKRLQVTTFAGPTRP